MNPPRLTPRTQMLLRGLEWLIWLVIAAVASLTGLWLVLWVKLATGASLTATAVPGVGGPALSPAMSAGNFAVTTSGSRGQLLLAGGAWSLMAVLTIAALVIVARLVRRLRHKAFFVAANIFALSRLGWVLGALTVLAGFNFVLAPTANALLGAACLAALTISTVGFRALFARGLALSEEGRSLI